MTLKADIKKELIKVKNTGWVTPSLEEIMEIINQDRIDIALKSKLNKIIDIVKIVCRFLWKQPA